VNRSNWTALLGLVAVSALALGCESQWRQENLVQNTLLDLAEHGPLPPDGDAHESARRALRTCEAWSRVDRDERAKNLEACFAAGRQLLWDESTKPDPELAKSLLQIACIQGLERACTEFGVALILHPGSDDPKTGVKILSEECGPDLGVEDARACGYRALALELGLGTDVDLDQALTTYDELCGARRYYRAEVAGERAPYAPRTRDGLACMRLARLAERGVIHEPEEVVAQLYADVCEYDVSVESFGRVACPKAAVLFKAHGYTFRAVDLTSPGEVDHRGGTRGATDVHLAAQGCAYGATEGCVLLKENFAEQDARGELFDLR
jgi:TPR repeat protein